MIVTVYSTSGKNNVKIETSATTFGELKPQLIGQGYNLNGMKAVVGESRVTLEADAALLPQSDFKLFLMPFKTKSGVDIQSLDRPGVYSEIQRLIGKYGDSARNYFNQYGNYTRTKTTDLKSLLESYSEPTSSIPTTNNVEESNLITVSKDRLESVLEKLLDVDSTDLTIIDENTFNEAVKELQDIIDNSSTEELKALEKEANELRYMFPDVF